MQKVTQFRWAVTETLRGSFFSDEVAEAPAFLFFLKRFTDLAAAGRLSGWPMRDAALVEASLAQFSWENLAKVNEPGRAFIELLEKIESQVHDLHGLSAQARFAQVVAKRGDFYDTLEKTFQLVADLDTTEMSDLEAATVYQDMLDSMAERAASSVTPTSVRKLLVGLVNPRAGESVYDPVCGYASLLCDAARGVVTEQIRQQIVGQDLNASTLLMARINVLLHGIGADLQPGDTLVAPATGNPATGHLRRFDVVLANPPFGMKLASREIEKDIYGRFDPVLPVSSELAFVLHAVASMAPEGRAAILIPNGILFRGGSDAIVRRHLVEAGRIAAVVALPAHLFPGTPISVSVLVLRGEETAETQKNCHFIDLTSQAEGPITKRHLSGDGIALAAKVLARNEVATGISKIVGLDEMLAQECNLSVNRYVVPVSTLAAQSLPAELDAFRAAIGARNAAEDKAMHLLNSFREGGRQ